MTPYDRARETGRLARIDQPESITHASFYAAHQHHAAAEHHELSARVGANHPVFALRHRQAARALRISAEQEATHSLLSQPANPNHWRPTS